MTAALPILGLLTLALGVLFQVSIYPKLHYSFGIGRAVVPRNNDNCQIIPELEACEDTWYHQPSGLLYLACSSRAGRMAWLPNTDSLHLEQRPDDDYFAILDTKAPGPLAQNIKRVKPSGFFGNNGKGSYNLHGFGVYLGNDGLGSDDSMRLFVINHRPQPDAAVVGANSTIELFTSKLGSDTMEHVRTFADPAISTPNNLVPTGPDSFVYSNDHSQKVGLGKKLDFLLSKSSLGYCDPKNCKIIASPVLYPNGLAGGSQYPNKHQNIIYQASTATPYIFVYELQADKSLVLVDKIKSNYPMDNINIDENGDLWIAGFPKALNTLKDITSLSPDTPGPSIVLRASKNKDKDAFYGQKYTVEHIVEDDGHVIGSGTVANFDTERGLVFSGSVVGPSVICKVNGV